MLRNTVDSVILALEMSNPKLTQQKGLDGLAFKSDCQIPSERLSDSWHSNWAGVSCSVSWNWFVGGCFEALAGLARGMRVSHLLLRVLCVYPFRIFALLGQDQRSIWQCSKQRTVPCFFWNYSKPWLKNTTLLAGQEPLQNVSKCFFVVEFPRKYISNKQIADLSLLIIDEICADTTRFVADSCWTSSK